MRMSIRLVRSQVLERLSKVSDEAIEDLVTNHSFSSDGFAAGDGLITAAQVLGINDVDYQAWLDYGAFLQRKWFTRIWVVQEKYFADEPDALIGKHRMAWSIILKASQVMIRSNMDTLLKAYVDFCMDDDDYNVDRAAMELTDNRLDNQRIFSSLQRTSLRNWTLEGLLYCTRSFDATESRDRVFALKDIWMAQRQHALQHIEIEIDYNKPLSQIYYEATLIAVVESQSLGIIGLTEDSLARNGKDLASWVPNYSAKATMNLLSGHPEQTGMPDRWQASLGLKFIDPKMESEHHLQVLGLEHDSIAETGPGYIDIMNRFSIESLLEFLENYPDDKYPTNEVPCDAFLKTLIKNTFRDRCVGSEACEAFPAFLMQRILELGEQLEESKYRNQAQDTKKLSRQFQSAKDIVTILSSNARGERLVPSFRQIQAMMDTAEDPDSPEGQAIECRCKDMEESFRVAYLGRRVFRTTHGLFGITSQSVDKGDRIWILAGAGTPFVLRGVDRDKWKVVGEAYVHGIMHGEAVRKDDCVNQVFLV